MGVSWWACARVERVEPHRGVYCSQIFASPKWKVASFFVLFCCCMSCTFLGPPCRKAVVSFRCLGLLGRTASIHRHLQPARPNSLGWGRRAERQGSLDLVLGR